MKLRDHFAYSSAGRPEDQAFDEYARLYSHGSDVARGEGPFWAEVRAWRLPGFILFDRRLTGVVHSRDVRVLSDGFDHVVVHAVLEGRLKWSDAAGSRTVNPGDILFVDTTQPSRTLSRDVHMLTASISRHLVESAIGNARVLHGRLLSPPSTLLLRDFLLSLVRWLPMLPEDENPNYSRVLADLISATLTDEAPGGAAARRLHSDRLTAIERCIAARLGDRDLSADKIAAATGLSRSVLYRLLQSHGGVNQLILTRRLQAVRSAIDNGSTAPLSELAHAYGFASESHMSRRFREAFGKSPGAYRRIMTALPESDPEKGHRRWRGWMGSLR